MLASEIARAFDTTAALDGDEGDAVAKRMAAECIRDLAVVAKAAQLDLRVEVHAALANCRRKGWLE